MSAPARPRVVYVLPEYDPETSGHFFYLYELLRETGQELDISVIIERAIARPDFARFRVLSSRRPTLRLIELLWALGRERFSGRRWFYVHYSFAGALAAIAIARFFGGTVCYWNCGMPWLYRRSRSEEAVFRFILRHATLVTGTAGLARAYARHYGLDLARIRVLPNWISTERFRTPEHGYDRRYIRERLGIPPSAKVVLFVHRLSRRKGAHLLADILAGVIAQRKDGMLLAVGDGPERKNLESRVQNLGLGAYARIVGAVAQRDIAPYFLAADVFLMPSEEEGFPHVLLEAMAAGLPYVASDVGGVAEITPPELQPFIVPSGDTRLMSKKISELLAASPIEIQHVAEIERRWVERYDISAVGEQFAALFDK